MSIVLPPESQQNRRRHRRYTLRRPCTLIFNDLQVTAQLADISLGGAGICLPMHVANYGRFTRLIFRLPDVGGFRSDMRWTCDRRMGLQFDPIAHRAAGLLALLAELDMQQPDAEGAGLQDDADFARVVSRGSWMRRPLPSAGVRPSGATPPR